MRVTPSLHLALGAIMSFGSVAFGLNATDADDMWNAFNNVFLNQNGSIAYYQKSIDNSTADPNWPGSFDIFVAQDVYLRTGDPAIKSLVNDLTATWLKFTPAPWHWDGFNDDIGWYTLGLIRGYQITGNPRFLTPAANGFEYAFGRGWNTTYNDGGIWEENPEYIKNGTSDKQALSNDSLGKVACMLYQSTNNATYLDQCQQIYGWVHTHLFNTTTGQINNGVRINGSLDRAKEAYNQGTFLDYANLLWKITGNQSYYDDAKLAMEFGKNNITVKGVFSTTQGNLNSWADEFARGGGNFVADNNLWSTYYPFFVANADAIMTSRRTDLNITWNAWNQPTSLNDTQITNKFVSAVAWLQYTPVTQPAGTVVGAVAGIRVISNNQTGLALDSAGAWGNGTAVVQNGKATASGQQQKWALSQNSLDLTWNVINLSTWQALQAADANATNANAVVQWQPNRNADQRWSVEQLADGTFKIYNQQTGLALDGGANAASGAPLIQSAWTGSAQQRWVLQ